MTESLEAIDVVAAASHELKAPLTLIVGLSELMLNNEAGNLTAKQRDFIERITATGSRSLLLLDSLLSIGKLHHNALALEPEPVLIKRVVLEVLHELQLMLKRYQINVAVSSARGWPVIADQACLYQILFNLLDNAIKYSKPKSTVTVKWYKRKDKLAILISDQGVGIKPKEIKYLFNRFGKLTQPINAYAGSSGLGLYIAKRLTMLSGGTIYAKAVPKGSCFVVELPLVKQLNLFN